MLQRRRAKRCPPALSLILATFVFGTWGTAKAQQSPSAAEAPQRTPPAAEPESAEVPASDANEEAGTPEGFAWPKLVHFEEAEYPEAAEKEGLQANVPLSLDIDAEGNVTNASVLQQVGYGFDEAAEAAAMKFKFEPARQDGQALAVRIKYMYRFTLSAPAPPPPEEAPKPPPVGNLGGQVRISAEDTPLASAQVLVSGPTGVFQATTDAEGKWELTGLPPGKYSVSVKAEGFEGLEATEDVAAGEVTEATYRLDAKTEGLEIVVRGERPPREVTRRTIERREMSRIPGTSGDALRSIQSLPGVARPPGLAGLLIVRGSAPQSTEIFVDGSSVPLIYHFGGLSSAIPTELLDRIDFYPGNFSSRYGRVMGGVVDVALRSPNTQCNADYGEPSDEEGCFHGLAQIDLIDTRALLQGPIGGGWSFAIAGRRSWVDTWLKPALEAAGSSVTSAPVYYDYQIIADHKTDESDASVRFFGSDDRLELIINDPAVQDPGLIGGNLTFSTSFYRAQGVYRVDLTRNVELTNMVSAGRSKINFSLGQIRFDLDTKPINVRNELGLKFFDGFQLDIGQDVVISPFDVLVRAPSPPRPGEPDPGPFSGRSLFETVDSGTIYRPAWYAEAEVKPTQRMRVVPGLRVDYARDSGHMDFSPRINARYDLIGGAAEKGGTEPPRRRTTLKGGVGFYYEPPQFQETDDVFGTPGLRSNRSIHYIVGVEQEITDNIEISVEGYYKDLDKLVSRAEAAGGTFLYDNAGTGSVIGAETLLKYKADKRFFGWLAYTLSRSVRTDRPGEEERLFQYDQTHILTALGSYRLGRGWEFGARFRLVSGQLTTPVIKPPGLPALYAADAGSYARLDAEPFSERLPLFHQLDVRIDKAWQFKDWRLSVFLDVLNSYNHAARQDLSYNYNFTRSSYTTGLPIIPNLGLRGEF